MYELTYIIVFNIILWMINSCVIIPSLPSIAENQYFKSIVLILEKHFQLVGFSSRKSKPISPVKYIALNVNRLLISVGSTHPIIAHFNPALVIPRVKRKNTIRGIC